MKILLKNATVIDRNNPLHCKSVSLLIVNGIIKQIKDRIDSKVDLVIENENLHISRGWWDPSVSFGEPGFEERETINNGLKVAAKSGFTAIGLNPDVFPATDNFSTASHLINKSKNHTTSLYPIGCLTDSSKGIQMASLFDLNQAGAIAFGDYKKSVEKSNLLKIALEYSQTFNGIVSVYPLDEGLSNSGIIHEGSVSTRLGLKGMSSITETTRIARDIEILKHTGGKLHFSYISSKDSLKLIEKAKTNGLNISCSVALPHLLFTDDSVNNFDANFKFFPPLRTIDDKTALREGLLSGIIDCVTSMHEPKNLEIKNLDFCSAASGSIGLEAFFSSMNNIFPIEKTIQFLTRGKNIFGIEDPEIEEGSKANLSFFNPDVNSVFKNENILSTSKNCCYVDQPIKGEVLGSINNGLLTLND